MRPQGWAGGRRIALLWWAWRPRVTGGWATTCRVTNVFYEQYLTLLPEGLATLGLCLLPTFVICCLLLGMDLRSGLLNLFSILMILVDTVGFMALWGISYNAVSLINLVTVSCVGDAVLSGV